MTTQEQFTAALNAEAAALVAQTLATDSRPWWQREDVTLIEDLTDDEIDDAPGFGDLWAPR